MQSSQGLLNTHVLSVKKYLPCPGTSTSICALTVGKSPMSVLSARKGLLVSIYIVDVIFVLFILYITIPEAQEQKKLR